MATVPQAIRIWEGNSTQQGATWDGLGVNFSLFSANATKVELCLFDQNGTQEIQRIELPEHTDEIWHGYLPDGGYRPFSVFGRENPRLTLGCSDCVICCRQSNSSLAALPKKTTDRTLLQQPGESAAKASYFSMSSLAKHASFAWSASFHQMTDRSSTQSKKTIRAPYL